MQAADSKNTCRFWNSAFASEPLLFSQNKSFFIGNCEIRIGDFIKSGNNIFRIESVFYRMSTLGDAERTSNLHANLRQFYTHTQCPLVLMAANIPILMATELVSSDLISIAAASADWKKVTVVPNPRDTGIPFGNRPNHYFTRFHIDMHGNLTAYQLRFPIFQYSVVRDGIIHSSPLWQ
jgi:hypothetical protein